MTANFVNEEEKALEEQHVIHTFGRSEVEFVRGEGTRLYDVHGNEYLDFLAGIAVCSLGHCNKKVVAAIQKQTEKLMHVSNYFYIEGRGRVSKKVSDMLNFACEDKKNWKMFFTNSGAESNECALKIARFYSNRNNNCDGQHSKVVVLKKSFHGRTFETLAATAQNRFHVGLAPMSPVFIEVEANNEEQLKQVFDEQGDKIAAMVFEPIQGESGVHPLTDSYIKLIRELTKENSALMICDEVQTGVCRTGFPFAFQLAEVVPDVVTIAKGIADGFPCGICATQGEAAEVLQPGDHGSTFGGSCLAIAAIEATLDELQEKDVMSNVIKASEYLTHKLNYIDGIEEVRGRGLMIGADLKDGIDAHDVVNEALLNQKLVINATGDKTLRFVPPLIISKEDVELFAERLQKAILAVA